MFSKKYLQLCITLLFVLNFSYCLSAQESFLTPEEILQGWEGNYGNVRNMNLSCSVNSKNSTGDYSYRLDRVEEGEKFKANCTIEEKGSTIDNTEKASFNGNFSKKYRVNPNDGFIHKGKTEESLAKKNPLSDFLLMRVPAIKSGIAAPPEFANFFYSGKNPGQLKSDIKVHPSLEIVSGHECHLVEFYSESDSQSVKIWVAHDKGMIPMKFELNFQVGDKNYLRSSEIKEIKMTDGGLWYPVKGIKKASSPRRTSEEQFEASSFDANINLQDKDFEIEFPEGSKVYDDHLGLTYYVEAVAIGKIHKRILKERVKDSNPDNARAKKTAKRNAPEIHSKDSVTADREDISNETPISVNSKMATTEAEIEPSTNKLFHITVGLLVVSFISISLVMYKKKFSGR